MNNPVKRSCLLLAAFCLSLHAQDTAGTITGSVTDSSGAAIPRAAVKIANQATGISRQVQTDDTGFYLFANVLPAIYEISVSAPGFKQFRVKDVALQVKAGLRVDARLEVGEISETVRVEGAQAPLLESVSSKVGAIVETKQITELPLNGRQFAQLILLTPGALPISLGQSSSFKVQLGAGSYSPVINGQRSRFNNFTLDGIENNDPMFNSYAMNPSVDAIQEFTVQTRGGVAEQGRSMGSDIVVVTRSGGNQFHGAAWEFLRNQKLDARNFFDSGKPAYRQNQFGGTFGGPLRLPHYNGRDRTFFFGYYEGFRSIRSANNITTVPTEAMRGGDFSAATLPRIYDITTTRANAGVSGGYARDLFPGNQIPSSRLNSNALAILQSEYPLPNMPGVSNNYINTMGLKRSNDQGSLRIDHKFTDNNNLFGRISYNNGTQRTPGGIPVVTTILENVAWNGTVSDTHILRSNLIAHLQFGFNRYTSSQGSGALPEKLLSAAGWDKVYPAGAPYYLVLGLNVSDIASAGGYAIPLGPHNTYQSIGDLTWIKGRHTFKTGLTWNTLHSFQASPQATIGFGRQPTSDLGNQGTTGYGVATFLLGLPTDARRAGGDTSARLSNNEYAGFVQDEIRLTPKLTLSAGLRYSYVQPMKEARNAYSGLDIVTGQYLLAITNPITGAGPNLRARWVDPQWKNLAPRLGLAYLLGSKTTIRAGAGIYYSYTDYVQYFGDPAGQWPFGYSEAVGPLNAYFVDANLSNPFSGSAGVKIANSPEGQGGYSINPRMKTPYGTQWTFSVQRQLPSDMLAEATYVGSNSIRLLQSRGENKALPGPGAIQARRRWPNYGGWTWDDNGAPSSYNGLSTRLTKRFSRGISILSSYTWSHNLDVWSTERGGTSSPQDPLNWRADHASSSADVQHTFLFSNTWELPFGRKKRLLSTGPLSYVLGNWQWSNIIGLYGGQPVNVQLGYDNANIGGSTQRPNLAGNPIPANQSRLQWINKAAFAVPALYTYGNAGRNLLRGPGTKNWDIALMKNIPLREQVNLQFRSEFFNAFNFVNFGSPDSNYSSQTFGVITSARASRSIQFSLKLSF